MASELVALRAVVGCLGEQAVVPWWKSSFFRSTSRAFLQPTFPRTTFAARCHGVREAACRVHDEVIGTGRVYHLFRLPEDLEQGLHRCLFDGSAEALLGGALAAPEKAMEYLQARAVTGVAGAGPRHIGTVEKMRSVDGWKTAAGVYLVGFNTGEIALPYFADNR